MKHDSDFVALEKLCLTFGRLAALGLLSSAIMHDIRNALTVLSGNVQILLMKGDRADRIEIMQRLERAMAQIERIENQIGRADSFSRRTVGGVREFLPEPAVENAIFAAE